MNVYKLIKKVRSYNSNADIGIIKRAYAFANEAHKGKKRESGDSYIIHPLNVAFILADFHLDEKTIAAGLLHDVVEDSLVRLKEIEKNFGKEIASLVDGVTNISKIKKDKETFDSENIIKMLMASTSDVRVILIKLADRLHNMRTLQYLNEERRKKIAKSTIEIYAPIAYRLGLYSVKGELEDLSFKFLFPKEYHKIKRELKASEKKRNQILEQIKNRLETALENADIKARIQGRIKHLYSIYKKLERKGINLKDISDLVALRVIAKNVKECYEILGIAHNLWKPVPGRLKDMIALPKSNLYQSIHTTLIGDSGVQFEIQIRTEDMHKIAEEGIAAHWKYKGVETDSSFDKRLSWLKEITELKREDPKEFLESMKVDLFGYEIYVFTPKGKVIVLPRGSSVLDFAYNVHSDIGNRGIGAKVNGKFVGLKHELKNGDIVEIITAKHQKPSREWLQFVKTLKARDGIRKALKLEKNIPVRRFIDKKRREENVFSSFVNVKGTEKMKARLARCCNPLPGDDIIGLHVKDGVAIHKKTCEVIKGQKKKAEVYWVEHFDSFINIGVLCEDRIGLMADIMNTMSRSEINVEKATAKTMKGGMAQCSFTIKFHSLEKLSNLLSRLKKVASVKRISLSL